MRKNKNGFSGILIGVIVAIIIVVAIVGIGFVMIKRSNSPSNTQSTSATGIETVAQTTSTTSQPSSTQADWKIYKNTEYGFQLTLNDSWKGYRVETSSDVTAARILPDGFKQASFTTEYISFEVPTKDKNFGSSGWITPFYISISPKEIWAQGQSAGLGGEESYLVENNQYVFMYGEWQDTPYDMVGNKSDYNLESTA